MISVDQASLFFALLAVIAQLGAVVLGGLAVAALVVPSLRLAFASVRAQIGPVALTIAAAVGITCTAGSLYFSEVANFPPCRLCWYQRICMYPVALILGIAAWRRDVGSRLYALPLAGIGALIAAYHVLLERYPSLESGACEIDNPCTIIWVERFGYVTIPVMALSGFLFICSLLAYAKED